MKNYGFNKTIVNYKNLVHIYEVLEPMSKFVKYKDWLDREYIAMIIPDNFKEICIEDQKMLSKQYWTYKQNYFNWIGTKQHFDSMVKAEEEHKKRAFSSKKRNYTTSIKEGGVYGVYKNGELIYIGSSVNFEKRWAEHKRYMKNRDYKLHFYKLFQPGDRVDFKVLIDGSKLEADREITPTDLKTMEYALISVFKPVGNIAGRIQPFKYK